MKILKTILLILICVNLQAQEFTQTVKGKIVSKDTEEPLAFANIHIKDTDPIIGGTSDIDGNFELKNVPVGRVNIEVSYIGYESLQILDVVVNSAKEVQLDIKLNPSFSTLGEIVVAPKINKQEPINAIASVSARMLSIEEGSRYAGGFDDPARLASSFAGVASGNGEDNSIIVRGNAPKFLQWKIEGIEIPNPNHFANLNSFGGGGLTALSSSVLANSDFMTGAFPSEYNNALAGVFDIKMRTGNTSDYQHSFEAGLIGIGFASEGPLTKNNGSYLVNYRYSTLALIPSMLPEDADGTKYQDLSFKLNFPNQKLGTFSLWGIGLIDESDSKLEKDVAKREYYQDIEVGDVKQYMGAIGLNHKLRFKNSAYLNSTLAFTTEGIDMFTDRLDENEVLQAENIVKNTKYNIEFKSYYNRRFSERLSNRTGVSLRGMGYDLDIQEADENKTLQSISDENGFSYLASAYTNFTISGKKLKFNFGLNSQLFTLNNKSTIEPRLGVKYQLNDRNSFSFGYGLHSRLEPLQVYFIKPSNGKSNKDLDFTKSHHFVLGYDWNISEKLHVKIEPYYQELYDVPIANNSNESLLNLQGDWFLTDTYTNTGKGRNYGIDLTLEQYMHKGFYYLLSGSLFKSQYKTANSDWFNTRYNKKYLFNALIGKEFLMGDQKQNALSFNLRLSIQGGERFSKIDEIASSIAKDVEYDETVPFNMQTDASTVVHATINYTWNKKKTSHRLSLKILNLTGYEGFHGHKYNIKTGEVKEDREALMIPNLSYKISF
ncbi:prevent-host-death protein [Marinifilum sp. N1E240]|uniref:TonB-dependent receptor n=1 Tax=Marinifilum sp. N1E240 TaxID=2608082 RepID=UPI00128D4E52|nr:TonB-dependent receptor [Marinifilum sp. N1E240]MPQ48974.1 prevent-host-death protein [Marinifilum sp. N1E240]